MKKYLVFTDEKDQANGIASLDNNAKIPKTQIPILTASDVGARPNSWTPSATDIGAVPISTKGKANGVASLDSNGKIPANQLPPISPSGKGVEAKILWRNAGAAHSSFPAQTIPVNLAAYNYAAIVFAAHSWEIFGDGQAIRSEVIPLGYWGRLDHMDKWFGFRYAKPTSTGVEFLDFCQYRSYGSVYSNMAADNMKCMPLAIYGLTNIEKVIL